MIGKGEAKALVSSISLDGLPVKDDDVAGWRHIASFISYSLRRKQIVARWRSFAAEVGAPGADDPLPALETARRVIAAAEAANILSRLLSAITDGTLEMGALADEPDLCRSVVHQIRAASGATRLSGAQHHIQRTVALFDGCTDPTSTVIKRFFKQAVGRQNYNADQAEDFWRRALRRIDKVRSHSTDFEVIKAATDMIGAAGAPQWAQKLRTEPASDSDPLLPRAWRDGWDYAAADATLSALDANCKLTGLAAEREHAETRCRKLFAELVRERTFYKLEQRLSPSVKAALVQFVVALKKIGKGTGKGAGDHRGAARDALARCYDAVPCWIMPTWRVAEQLPAELGAVDLVIIDEASQSDVTELPALLRGEKILVVGDDRQVSPTPPFVTLEKISQLRHHYLRELPFKNLLEPGESIYHLMRAVFPDERLMLKEHFRCVEPIIRFSMQFYPEKLVPLRVPTAQERLDPPLIDIYVPHGRREARRKINPAEAQVIVNEIAALVSQPEMQNRSVGVISLIGSEQANFIRAKLSDELGEELMQRHSILCGDSATFQGTERDIVFLSMVADPNHRKALTMDLYEQRFNVAVSRARDRLVLVRSVKRDELSENDLKARLLAHFENPMPAETPRGGSEECESKFERDMMRMLTDRGYRVQAQVGSLGFRIDLVVEGANGRRLAIECDGDHFHGPAQWRDDMRRQRVLERVGWRFWRCFASSFYHDQDGTMSELLETLTRLGIDPSSSGEAAETGTYTEMRISGTSPATQVGSGEAVAELGAASAPNGDEIRVGDQIIVLFADDRSRLSVRLTDATHDISKGLVSIRSPLGEAICKAELWDEVEFEQENGNRRRAWIENIDKDPVPPPRPAGGVPSKVGGKSLTQEPTEPHRSAPSFGQTGTAVIHQGEYQWGSFRAFADGSIEVETHGVRRWYRDFAELERSQKIDLAKKGRGHIRPDESDEAAGLKGGTPFPLQN
ncbi:MAG TPA: AAA domain-containing protein [Hyphomicrobiaceae bacterium]|nr:AAA domain-containing protein [Hyphomicrobiaceae bacterium]